ncbi:hypothetical protein [Paenibacillus alvei]|uniref:hypothetical protein n=1 Tax=Paenibacillus alvei TaxID=44250 RepID=UPI0013D92212|nr:hypothetical protein [Paenibacillus alvei]NEZ44587.1 hypothetical protein [Paenibacillus alvei]
MGNCMFCEGTTSKVNGDCRRCVHFKALITDYLEEKKHQLWYEWRVQETPGGRTYIGMDRYKTLIVVLTQKSEEVNHQKIYLNIGELKEMLFT